MIRSLPALLLAASAPLLAQTTQTATTAAASSGSATTSSSYGLDTSGSLSGAYSTPHNSHLSEQLADSMPHYMPPKPAPVVQPQPAATVDLRDVDKPKNHINRLPAYMVHGTKPPIFQDKVSETHEGRTLLGLQKFKGLNLSPILNKPIAEQMQYDEERQQNISDLQDEASAIGRGVRSDAAEKDFIQQASQDTYMRHDDGYSVRGPGG